MKKKLLSIAVGILAYCQLSAQTSLFTEKIGWRGKAIQLHTISDKEKRLNCLFLMNSDSIRIWLMDEHAQVSREWRMKRNFEEKLLGGFVKDGILYGLFRVDHGLPRVHGWAIDLHSDKMEDYYIPWEPRKEQLINRLSCGDHLLFFAVNKKTSEFILYDFRDGRNYDTLHYQFGEGVWQDLSQRSGFSRTVHVAKLDQEGESSVENAGIPNKVYFINDTLYLTMTNNRGMTMIWSFRAQDRLVKYREIRHNYVLSRDTVPNSFKDNSYLLDGKLYYTAASSDSLYVQVDDFASGQVLQQFAQARDKDIEFKNTPIIQEGADFGKHITRELDKTNQLVRKMLNGNAVIMAGRDDSNRVVVSVGSYVQVSSGGGGGGMMMFGGAVGGAVAGATTGMYFMPTGGFYRETWTKSARFKMLLDPASLQHIGGEIAPTINEKIENYTKDLLIPSDGENLFVNNGKYVYAYYDRDEHALKLVNF